MCDNSKNIYIYQTYRHLEVWKAGMFPISRPVMLPSRLSTTAFCVSTFWTTLSSQIITSEQQAEKEFPIETLKPPQKKNITKNSIFQDSKTKHLLIQYCHTILQVFSIWPTSWDESNLWSRTWHEFTVCKMATCEKSIRWAIASWEPQSVANPGIPGIPELDNLRLTFIWGWRFRCLCIYWKKRPYKYICIHIWIHARKCKK